jgi:hypothetical protein
LYAAAFLFVLSVVFAKVLKKKRGL